VTANINVDELVLELRRVTKPHRDTLPDDTKGAIVPLPPMTSQDVKKVEPVARVVMTFSAAKSLYDFLTQAVPEFEAARRSGLSAPKSPR
jgi:hypothetical protein